MLHLTIMLLFTIQTTANAMLEFPQLQKKDCIKRKSLGLLTPVKTKNTNDPHINNNNSLLLNAVQGNNLNELIAILNPNINSTDNGKNTLLNMAVRNKNTYMVRILLEQNAVAVNEPNEWGNTPLHNATLLALPDIINLLLQDPRVDTTKENNQKKRAHEFVTSIKIKNNDFEIRTLVDQIVNKETPLFQHSNRFNEQNLNATINKILTLIKNKLIENKLLVSKNALCYMTPEFIKKMILSRVHYTT